jgi:hypothetical protein
MEESDIAKVSTSKREDPTAGEKKKKAKRA